MKNKFLTDKNGGTISSFVSIYSVVANYGIKLPYLLERLISKREVNSLLKTKQDTLTYDSVPTRNSGNPVRSDGIYNAIMSLRDRVELIDDRIIDDYTEGKLVITQDGTITDSDKIISNEYYGAFFDKVRSKCRLVSWVNGDYDNVTNEPILKEVSKGDKSLYENMSNRTTSEDLFVEIPALWYKCEETGGENSDIWTFTMKLAEEFTPTEGDTTWKKYKKHLIAVYKGYVDDSTGKLRSLYNRTPTAGKTWAEYKTYARNNGSGFSILDWESRNILAWIFYGLYGSTNFEKYCGLGDSVNLTTTGKCDGFGIYDTSKKFYCDSVNFLGIENLWYDGYEFIDNIAMVKYGGGLFKGVYVLDYNGDELRLIRSDNPNTGSDSNVSKMILGEYGDLFMKELGNGYVGGQVIGVDSSALHTPLTIQGKSITGMHYIQGNSDNDKVCARLVYTYND